MTKLSSTLILGTNSLTGAIPTQLGSLTALEANLALAMNSLSSSIPTQLGDLQEMKGADNAKVIGWFRLVYFVRFVRFVRCSFCSFCSFGFVKPAKHRHGTPHAP